MPFVDLGNCLSFQLQSAKDALLQSSRFDISAHHALPSIVPTLYDTASCTRPPLMIGPLSRPEMETVRRKHRQCRQSRPLARRDGLVGVLLLSAFISSAQAIVYPSNHEKYSFDYLSGNKYKTGNGRSLTKRDGPIPLVVTNNCPETVTRCFYPARRRPRDRRVRP